MNYITISKAGVISKCNVPVSTEINIDRHIVTLLFFPEFTFTAVLMRGSKSGTDLQQG